MDQIFGDTESSRAIAAIVTLIRREFGSPRAGLPGETLGLLELLTGTVAFALLQRWCSTRTEQELEDQETIEIVWDVVVLDNGRRADVITARPSTAISARNNRRRASIPARSTTSRPTSFVSVSNDREVFEALPREDVAPENMLAFPQPSLAQDGASITAGFDRLLMTQLPPAAQFSITSVVTKLVTVEISGQLPSNIQPPPGFSIIAQESQDAHGLPFHRILFEANEQNVDGSGLEQSRTAKPSSPAISPPAFPMPIGTSGRDGTIHSNSFFGTDCEAVDPGYDAEKSPLKTSVIQTGISRTKEPRSSSSSFQDTHNSASSLGANAFQANQKRQRTSPMSRLPVSTGPWSSLPLDTRHARKKVSSGDLKQKKVDKPEKKKSLRQTIKQGASNSGIANLWSKELLSRPTARKSPESGPAKSDIQFKNSDWNTQSASSSSRAPLPTDSPHSLERSKSPSRTNFYSVHHREESLTSETYVESLEPESSKRLSLELDSYIGSEVKDDRYPRIRTRSVSCHAHSRSSSVISGTFTMTNDVVPEDMSLKNPNPNPHDHDVSLSLNRSGCLPGQFPRNKFAQNIWRYSKYATATYGSTFLRLLGAVVQNNSTFSDEGNIHHKEHHSFSNYVNLEPSTILLSSFVDPQGGTDASGQTETGVPLVHYISLDHVFKTVVLSCRGTLEFDDVLADMTCDYDRLTWQGNVYNIHKGILASARRLLEGKGGRVMAVINAALEEFEDYGLVLCGHSLGGAVTAVLAMLLSEPNTSNIFNSNSPAFVTSTQHSTLQPLQLPSTDPSSNPSEAPAAYCSPLLPPGRAIHVYAYGAPATVSPSLARACRGLITTICHNADLIPYLSLGTLRDIQAVALAFKTDTGGAKAEIKQRVWGGLTSAFHGRFGGENFWDNENGLQADLAVDDTWPWAALKSLRANMIYEKLVPPGEVFVVETSRVLQRDAFTSTTPNTSEPEGEGGARGSTSVLGKPATRVQMKRVRDPEKWFGELRLRGSMFADHTPNRYENALAILAKGADV